MKHSLKIYREVAKAWLLSALKEPLYSITSDPKLDLDIFPKK